ncbi:MAG: YfhO family protein, partial [Chloroflexi bacterium]|nr:YfhO family protein [Chloroflexota bacterium]
LYIPNTDYPGWQAFVDGQPTRILRANLAFMSLEVPAGANEVRLEYHPWWLLPGTLVSLFSLIVTLVLFRSKNPGQEG